MVSPCRLRLSCCHDRVPKTDSETREKLGMWRCRRACFSLRDSSCLPSSPTEGLSEPPALCADPRLVCDALSPPKSPVSKYCHVENSVWRGPDLSDSSQESVTCHELPSSACCFLLPHFAVSVLAQLLSCCLVSPHSVCHQSVPSSSSSAQPGHELITVKQTYLPRPCLGSFSASSVCAEPSLPCRCYSPVSAL